VYEAEKFDKQRFKRKIPPGWAQVIVKQKKEACIHQREEGKLIQKQKLKNKKF
jgi:uncharacterized protein YbdZ (MbtH family)